MPQIHTLTDIDEGNKLENLPSNRYLPTNQDCEIAIECSNRLAHKCSILDIVNKSIQYNLNQTNKDKNFENSKLEHMKNMLTLKNGELELIKNDLAEKNSEIRSLETRLKKLLPCNRLLLKQVKIKENSQVNRNIQESLTQQTLTSLNNYIPKESEISNENPSLSHIISEIKNNNIPIKKNETLPVVTLGASEALVNYKY
ncbi:18402_t:CDS:2 [Gigaspora margarita]|uniref:18402_t:CDS:1 n=1 Tax=Gigaspora margarita TaxID=4874 RepID=A0ABN7VIX0_GIGMA|nr:18402_t:CDS:2 [Gigaspora margarita]